MKLIFQVYHGSYFIDLIWELIDARSVMNKFNNKWKKWKENKFIWKRYNSSIY